MCAIDDCLCTNTKEELKDKGWGPGDLCPCCSHSFGYHSSSLQPQFALLPTFSKKEKIQHSKLLKKEVTIVLSLLKDRRNSLGAEFTRAMKYSFSPQVLTDQQIDDALDNIDFKPADIENYGETRARTRVEVSVNRSLLHYEAAQVTLRWTLIHECAHAIRLHYRSAFNLPGTPKHCQCNSVIVKKYRYDHRVGEMGLYLQELFLDGITNWTRENGPFLTVIDANGVLCEAVMPDKAFLLVSLPIPSIPPKPKFVLGFPAFGKCGNAA